MYDADILLALPLSSTAGSICLSLGSQKNQALTQRAATVLWVNPVAVRVRFHSISMLITGYVSYTWAKLQESKNTQDTCTILQNLLL